MTVKDRRLRRRLCRKNDSSVERDCGVWPSLFCGNALIELQSLCSKGREFMMKRETLGWRTSVLTREADGEKLTLHLNRKSQESQAS